ncbi:hypothetical protein ABPG75_011793 [Micractinium tetrahymenae]
MDVEMGKSGRKSTAKPQLGGKRGRRGLWRLPLTVGGCFIALFIFFVFMGSGGGSGSSSSRRPGRLSGASVAHGGWGALPDPDGQPRVYRFRVLRELPHDHRAFTQGLQFDRICDGESRSNCREVFWESTGLNGQSTVREVDAESGKVLRKKDLPTSDFGEGVARHGDRLYQVTWQGPKTWSYSVSDLEDARELATPLKDGWGITSDGSHLIVGDSTDKLTWLDPADVSRAVREVAVKDGGQAVRWLNELEWADGLVWANVWMTDCIAQVDPASGAVVGWVRFGGLRERAVAAAAEDARASGEGQRPQREQPEVLNGIAWDEQGRRLFVTGKLWPRIYQVELEEVPAGEAGAALAAARRECIPQGDLRGFF